MAEYRNQPAFCSSLGALKVVHIGVGAQTIYPQGPGPLLSVIDADTKEVIEIQLNPSTAQSIAEDLLAMARQMKVAKPCELGVANGDE